MGSLRTDERGAALVELTLVLPILLFLAAALWEFGRVLDAQLITNNAAREGARYAALGYTATQVQDRVSLYLTNGLGARLNPTSGDVIFAKSQVTVTNALGFPGDPVSVQVPITVRFSMPGLIGMPNTIKLSGLETMRLECGKLGVC